jgi:hypothetical protein
LKGIIKDTNAVALHFKLCLQHGARDWIDDFVEGNPNADWAAIKKGFVARFVPKNRGTQVLFRLKSCIKSPNETVDEFTTAFQNIVNEAKPRMPERQQVDFYVMNLNELSADVINKEPITMIDAITYARAAELALQARRQNYQIGRGGPRAAAVHVVQSTQSTLEARVLAIETRITKLEDGMKAFKEEIITSVSSTISKEIAKAFRSPRRVSRDSNGDLMCYNCNKPGHIRPNCPLLKDKDTNDRSNGKNNSYSNSNKRNVKFNLKNDRYNTNVVESNESADEQESDYYNSENTDDDKSNTNPIVSSNCNIVGEKAHRNNKLDMKVQAEIAGIKTSISIDCGADYTLIDLKEFATLPMEVKETLKPIVDNVQLRCANGGELHQTGSVKVPVKLAGVDVGRLTFRVVKDLKSGILIGKDMLKLYFGNINVHENTIEFKGKDRSKSIIIKCNNSKAIGKDKVVGSLYLTTKHRIPPNSQYVTSDTRITGLGSFRDNYVSPLKAKEMKSYTAPILLVESGYVGTTKTVKIAPILAVADDDLLNKKRRMPIVLYNKSNQPITLKSGTRIGRIEAVHNSEVQEL